MIRHQGPLVTWEPGNARAEVTVRRLELNSKNRRQLIDRKIEHMEFLNELIAKRDSCSGVMRELAKQRVEQMAEVHEEFSGMVASLI